MLKFLVFADLHYKKGMYAAGVHHLSAILEKAECTFGDDIHAGA